MPREVIYLGAPSAFQTINVIAICVFLTLLEFAGFAFLVATRAVTRKLISALRGLVRRVTRGGLAWQRGGSAHPASGGT